MPARKQIIGAVIELRDTSAARPPTTEMTLSPGDRDTLLRGSPSAPTCATNSGPPRRARLRARSASQEPNCQNIPIRTEDGRKIRRAFVAPPGHKLISADYGQIEMRMLAEIGNVEVRGRAFRDGADIHAATAAEIFGIKVEDVPQT